MQFWSQAVACHQDNPLSIGDAYRLKRLLVECSVTLRRDGQFAVVEVELGGQRLEIIRELAENNFCHTVTGWVLNE